MTFAKPALLLFALVASTQASHVVQFSNNCPFDLTPVYKGNHDSPSASRAAKLKANGGKGSVTLPEIWLSGRIFAQDPKGTCLEPDGARCTLFECTFGPADKNGLKWNQCNISLVSGYNVPASFGYIGGKESSCDKSFRCLSPGCPSSEAYLVGDGAASCKNCISQCNTDGVGLRIEFCPSGSTIPNMGQKPTTTPPVDDGDDEDAPAFPGGDDDKEDDDKGAQNVAPKPTPTPTPEPEPKKRCAKSRLERLAAQSGKEKRGKLHFVGHRLGHSH